MTPVKIQKENTELPDPYLVSPRARSSPGACACACMHMKSSAAAAATPITAVRRPVPAPASTALVTLANTSQHQGVTPLAESLTLPAHSQPEVPRNQQAVPADPHR